MSDIDAVRHVDEVAAARDTNTDQHILGTLAQTAPHTHFHLIRNTAVSVELLQYISDYGTEEAGIAARLRIQRDTAPPPLEATAPDDLGSGAIAQDIRIARDPGTDTEKLLELAQSAPHTHHALARNDSAWPELLYWLLEFGDVTTKLRVITRSDRALGRDLREITEELFGAMASTVPVKAPKTPAPRAVHHRPKPDPEAQRRQELLNAARGVRDTKFDPGSGFGVNTDAYRPPTRSGAPGGGTAARPQVVYVRNVGTNGMAIAALVCSLLCLSFLGVIFGHVAIRQIDKSGESGRGIALAALIIGYISLLATVIYLIWLFNAGSSAGLW